VLTTMVVGAESHLGFISEFGARPVTIGWYLAWPALGYSAAMLGILGAHEMGHYLTCRYYDVDASLPFFLPSFPVAPLPGTLGAVIRIRERLTNRNVLFDMAIAGPIAGFVVLLPLLFLGMRLSNVVTVPPTANTIMLGEPLLMQLAIWLNFGAIPDGQTVNIHPMVFAAWFGMLATALNLLPFGQFDGGHLSYATLGDRSRVVSAVTAVSAAVMCVFSRTWILLTAIMFLMIFFMGLRHPPVVDEHEPLSRGRYWLSLFAIVMFVLCFIPFPIS
jgi:membrane-associated protease RseP (regulator of RpoE activity)